MKVLYVLAPSDRFNYGDMLFPYIILYYFKGIFDRIVFCSTTKSDLSCYGGIPTESYKILFRANPYNQNFLIVAGGDSLCINWQTILSFVDPFSQYLYILDSKLNTTLFSKIYNRLKFHATTRFPYSVGKYEFPNFRGVFYNALGGTIVENNLNLLNDKEVYNILKSIDYLSVRDKAIHNILLSKNIKNFLSPDSAILMSEVFSEAFLLSRISHLSSSILNEKFIFFQINEEHGKAREDFFSRVLARVADKTHLRICLCPIGIAPGHSDQTPLSKMSSLLGDKSVFIKHPSIWDIMYLIKHSAMYIGTSLHGTITAMSFNVKFIAHGPVKLENYVETWCNHTSNRFIEDYSNLEENILDVLNKDDLCNSSYQKQKVKLSFDSIKKIMAQ